MPRLHLQVLNKKQRELFSRLKFFDKYGFYLAGGTALTLHLGHRTSLDFDFYIQSYFDSAKLSQEIETFFGENIKINLLEKETIFCNIANIDLSLFWYKYPLLKPLIKTSGPSVASLNDIAAMKIIAVIQRPAKRDYIDLYYLLTQYPLETIFHWAEKKYPNFNPYLALRALSFFDDVESEKVEERGIKIFDKNFSWKEAKKKIFEEVKKYQLAMLKK